MTKNLKYKQQGYTSVLEQLTDWIDTHYYNWGTDSATIRLYEGFVPFNSDDPYAVLDFMFEGKDRMQTIVYDLHDEPSRIAELLVPFLPNNGGLYDLDHYMLEDGGLLKFNDRDTYFVLFYV